MVTAIFGAVVLWIFVGMLIFIISTTLDTGHEEAPPPEGQDEKTPEKEEGFFAFAVKAIAVFIQWPMLLMLIFRAAKNHRTPSRQSEAEIKALENRAKEVAARLVSVNLLILEGKKPLGAKWIKRPDCYMRQILFITKGANVVPLVTHHIKVKKWRVVECFRGLPDTSYQKLIGKVKSLKEAQKRCEQDTEWLDACTLYNLQTSDPKLVMFLEEMSNGN